MNLSRDFTLKIHYILDQLLNPVIRDSYYFMKFPMKLFFSKKYKEIMQFKKNLPYMTEEQYVDFYRETAPYHMSRDTDLNKKSISFILDNTIGESVLDIGCGRAFLVNKIYTKNRDIKIYGMDIVISKEMKNKNPNINFIEGSVEQVPFDDASVDTVICTHVLEHVIDMQRAIREIRRVAKKRIIIVVPSQRSYLYTFDLHVRFFPYVHSFLLEMMPLSNKKTFCVKVDGDIYYQEEVG